MKFETIAKSAEEVLGIQQRATGVGGAL